MLYAVVVVVRVCVQAEKPIMHFLIEQNVAGQYGLLAWQGYVLCQALFVLRSTIDSRVGFSWDG